MATLRSITPPRLARHCATAVHVTTCSPRRSFASSSLTRTDAPPSATTPSSSPTPPPSRPPSTSPPSCSPGPPLSPTTTTVRPRPRRSPAALAANLVGPPHAVSNLRPLFLTPKPTAADAVSSRAPRQTAVVGAAAARDAIVGPAGATVTTHPYSLSEFQRPTTGHGGGRGPPPDARVWHRSASRTAPPPSPLRSLRESVGRAHAASLASLEEAELEHRLGVAHTERVHQRFWADNNARYARALKEYRRRGGGGGGGAGDGAGDGASGAGEAAASSSGTASPPPTTTTTKGGDATTTTATPDDSLARFYEAWLRANAARHGRYNGWLWRRSWHDVRMAARLERARAREAAWAWARSVVGG